MHYNVGADLFTYVAESSRPVFAVHDGFIEAPTASGLGFEIDEDKVRKADFLKLDGDNGGTPDGARRAWRNAMFTGPDGSLCEW